MFSRFVFPDGTAYAPKSKFKPKTPSDISFTEKRGDHQIADLPSSSRVPKRISNDRTHTVLSFDDCNIGTAHEEEISNLRNFLVDSRPMTTSSSLGEDNHYKKNCSRTTTNIDESLDFDIDRAYRRNM